MDTVLKAALSIQNTCGGFNFVMSVVSWSVVIDDLKDYRDQDMKNFNCDPKPSDYTRQRCYHRYVSSLSPLLTPLDFAHITFGVSLTCWALFIIIGVPLTLKTRKERDPPKKRSQTSVLKTIFICHVCFQLGFFVVMLGLFCHFQILEFPADYVCTKSNITHSPTNRILTSNMTCNDLRYMEKSDLNVIIIAIMSFSILLFILTLLQLVVSKKPFLDQLLGSNAPDQDPSTPLVELGQVDANGTPTEGQVDANATQAEGQVDANATQAEELGQVDVNGTRTEEEHVDANGTRIEGQVDANATQAEELGQVDANSTPTEGQVNANATQAEETSIDANDTGRTEENEKASSAFTEEQLNFFRAWYIAAEILPQGLRSVFKQEWNKRYGTTRGDWQDTPKNGLDFYNGESTANQRRESTANQRRKTRFLEKMRKGDTAEWDCTMLFYAILYSDVIHELDPLIRSSVDDLRKFRNQFAHSPVNQLSNQLFGAAVRKVESAFQALGLPTAQIQTASKQNSFPIDNVQFETNVKKLDEELLRIKEQVQVSKRSLQHELESFCDVPPIPPHQIAGRKRDVATIVKKLGNLRGAGNKRLSYFYISGNPGSGKSQLAGLVAETVYHRPIIPLGSPSFVKTLNAENTETLLRSYASLALKVGCPENRITEINNSKDKTIEGKITNLKDLIETKVSIYKWWLLVVDNVTNLYHTLRFLPELGKEQWGNGQLLITTQNPSCIPPGSSLCSHISISKGMTPADSSCFLATISGIKDQTAVANKVAKKLDYQPLALASAATYVAQVRKLSPMFGWRDYLKKLKQGKRALTEEVLAKVNQSYPKSMTAATQIAVEREFKSDEVMKHVFTFLALCAPQPLRLDILIHYVLSADKDQDKDDVGLHVQGSSLFLIEKEKDSVYVRVHQVVHDMAKLVVNQSMNSDEHVRSVYAAVVSFNQFIEESMPNSWDELDSVAESRHFVGHSKTLSTELGDIFASEVKCKIFSQCITDVSLCAFHLRRLGRITQCNGEFSSAREYYSAAVKVIDGSKTSGDDLELARGCTGLGRVSSSLGFHHEGKTHLERALSIYLTNVGSDPVEVARIYSFLGKVERRLGNLQQAEKNFNSSLLILRKLNLERESDAAYTYRHLGSVQCDLGDHQGAAVNLQLALSICLETFDTRHVDVGRTFHYLGVLQGVLGNFDQAKEYHESAVSILLEKLGTDHVEVARAYRCLGVVEYDMEEKHRAKDHFELALSIFKKKLSPDHDNVVRTVCDLRLCETSS